MTLLMLSYLWFYLNHWMEYLQVVLGSCFTNQKSVFDHPIDLAIFLLANQSKFFCIEREFERGSLLSCIMAVLPVIEQVFNSYIVSIF